MIIILFIILIFVILVIIACRPDENDIHNWETIERGEIKI